MDLETFFLGGIAGFVAGSMLVLWLIERHIGFWIPKSRSN